VLKNARSDEYRAAADYGGARYCLDDETEYGQIAALRCLQRIGAGRIL
jgi:hypothetical protein